MLGFCNFTFFGGVETNMRFMFGASPIRDEVMSARSKLLLSFITVYVILVFISASLIVGPVCSSMY